jgi:hypothetical protein
MIPEHDIAAQYKRALFLLVQHYLVCHTCAMARGYGQDWRYSRLASMEGFCCMCGSNEIEELRDVKMCIRRKGGSKESPEQPTDIPTV